MNKEQIIEAIKNMTILELNELVKACEEEFGVSAAAPVAVAAAGATPEAETKDEFNVIPSVVKSAASGMIFKKISTLSQFCEQAGFHGFTK